MIRYGRDSTRYGYGTQYTRGGMGRGRGYFMPRGMNNFPQNPLDNNRFGYAFPRRNEADMFEPMQNSPNFRGGPSGRSRPLAQLVARSRDTRGPLRRGESNAYKMEVTEQFIEKRKGDDPEGPIPCVSVLDFCRITPNDVSQRRVCIPVALAQPLAKLIAKCHVPTGEDSSKHDEIVEEDHKDDEYEGDGKIVEEPTKVPTTTASNRFKYDLSLLKPCTLKCPKTHEVVEVENVTVDGVTHKHLRSYMNVPSKTDYKPGDPVEKIELRDELMRSLERFLTDVAVRYRNIKSDVTIPSLYSYSGERRFYYDLRRTRWGLRLHISQVTDMHRNVIGIPLEALVQFRDRLSDAIGNLQLEDQLQGRQQFSGRGKGRRRRPNRNIGRKRGFRKTENPDGTEEGKDKPSDATEAEGDKSNAVNGTNAVAEAATEQ